MTVSDLIKSSLRKIGALSTGETVSSLRYVDLLLALQVMLRSWAQKRILVYSSKLESFTLVPSLSSYTWGITTPPGNITTERPHKIFDAYVRSEGTDFPVKIISENRYNSIFSKTISGRPYYLFYHSTYPLGTVFLYPVPQLAETMFISCLKPFTETANIDNVDSILAFPPNYEEALVYNLAIRIAPEYGIRVNAETAAIADESYSALVTLNAANTVETVSAQIPGSIGGSRYNIFTGV